MKIRFIYGKNIAPSTTKRQTARLLIRGLRENCEENRDWRLERNVRAICTDRHRGRLLVRGERKEYNCYGVRNESTLGLEQITRIR